MTMIYAFLFVLLTVILFECHAQVNVEGINSSGGSTNIQGLSSTNKGSQVVNEINSPGNSKALLRHQHIQRGYVPYEGFYPNENRRPYERYGPNEWDNGMYHLRRNRPYGNFGHPEFYRPHGNYGF